MRQRRVVLRNRSLRHSTWKNAPATTSARLGTSLSALMVNLESRSGAGASTESLISLKTIILAAINRRLEAKGPPHPRLP